MVSSKLRILAGVSLLAIGTVAADDARAVNVPGVNQITVDTIAINLIDIDAGTPPVVTGANETVTNAGGHALAEALVHCAESATCAEVGAFAQYAYGTSASNGMVVDGNLAIGADAVAEGASATAAAFIQFGAWQLAAAQDAAENSIEIGGEFDIVANADALATAGTAIGFAGIAVGVSQIATAIGTEGSASALLGNSGALTIAANANAEALAGNAAAVAFVTTGIFQTANGQAQASADLTNSGSILIDASAFALAENGVAIASASAGGIIQVANARTEQFSSSTTSGGAVIATGTYTPTGAGSASLTNSGSIAVTAEAGAVGGVAAAATAGVLGILQEASGSSASVSIDNSGSVDIVASASAQGLAAATGVAAVSGITQAATAFAYHLVETVDPNGVLTYQLSATPAGPAVASLANSGDIAIAGVVDVVASGTTSMVGALGAASVDGLDQIAQGDGALASFDNSGSFSVVADVTVVSAGLADATAFASGINQSATAYASHATTIFGTGTTTPTSFVSSTAAGPAAVELNNSGEIAIVAGVDVQGGDFASGSAIAVGIDQFAAGTEASASVDNSGTITIGAVAEVAAGTTAYALAGVDNAIKQHVVASDDASASITNSGTIHLVAQAEALVAGGNTTEFLIDAAWADAFVVGINALATATGASGDATVDLANQGTIDIDATAHATGDSRATAIAQAVSGLMGYADVFQNGSAVADLTNEGTLDLTAVASATGGHAANVLAVAAGAMLGQARVFGEGDATASLTNEGDILVHAIGNADAGTNARASVVAVNAVLDMANASNGDALAQLTNSGSLTVVAEANATALVAEAHAVGGGSIFGGAFFQMAGAVNGDATAMLDNEGDIMVASLANANGEVYAYATVQGGLAINQAAFATAGDATTILTNSGTIELLHLASAEASHTAHAIGLVYNAVFNGATANVGDGEAIAELQNEGSIDVKGQATAKGVDDATAKLFLERAVGSNASTYEAGNASATLGNTNSIDVVGAAHAEALHGSVLAALETLIFNSAAVAGSADAHATIDNSGSIDITASASFDASGDYGTATALLNGGVTQTVRVDEGQGTAQLDNSGTLDILAVAKVDALGGALTDSASAVAFASGIRQRGEANDWVFGTATVFGMPATQADTPLGQLSVSLDNSGSIDLGIAANAAGDGLAFASASGILVGQTIFGLDAQAELTNSGSIAAAAQAIAEGGTSAKAHGQVSGIVQSANGLATIKHLSAVSESGYTVTTTTQLVGEVRAALTNSGTIAVTGLAQAKGGQGPATAEMTVRGLTQDLLGVGAPGASFDNSGKFKVAAKAEATAGTNASAVAAAFGYELTANNADLAFNNSGEFSVIAQATSFGASGFASAHAVGISANVATDGAITGSIDNSGELLVSAVADYAGVGSAVAHATGINVGAATADLSVSNSGLIKVSALTYGGTADATAFRIAGNGAGATVLPPVITFTNDGGTIIARRSEDGGTTWLRGTAIDTSGAPNAAVINLNGNGSIYGNILLGAGDTINVAGGETWFDGIINPGCLGGGACSQSTLNIGGGGALFMRHNGTEGPSAAYVEQFNMAGDGTIIFELPVDPASGYPQIFADVANLDGTLLVRAAAGLYDDSYQYTFIDADTRNGQFDFCGIEGGAALLELTCSYDIAGNVNLEIERIAFNAVDGLSRNQAGVGSGIEALYDVGLTGPFAEMVAQLFTFGTDAYQGALDQLAGADYASYQQSFHALGNRYNQLIDKATECAMPQRAASALDCRTDKLHVWGQLDVGSRRNDGDIEAAGYNSDRWTAIVGADALVGANAVVGASIAKVSDHADYRDGGSINADGYQLGAYATYDPGHYYAKVMGTFSSYDGDAKRTIDWSEFGGDLQGQLKGDPDVRLVTLGLHAGYRVEIGANSLLTPYANVDYSSVRLSDFTETGLAGADLTVDGSTSSRTSVAVGTKWAADLGAVIPQAELGYLYNFGDKRTAFDAAFLGDEDGQFEVVSSAEKRGSLLAGLSLGGKAGPVNVRIGYQGLFNGDGAQHNGGIRLTLPLGGR